MARKVKLDLKDLDAAIEGTPVEHREKAVTAARVSRRTSGDWTERLNQAGHKALDDIEQMLEYEFDEGGNQRSKIDDKTRANLNKFVVNVKQMADGRLQAIAANAHRPTIIIGTPELLAARNASMAMDARRLGAIDTTARQIPAGETA
jgi:hypothetical protein